MHGREKPYACTLCPYASSQKGNLRAHVRRLHVHVPAAASAASVAAVAAVSSSTALSSGAAAAVYRCDDCSAVFRSVSSLTAHMTKFHGDAGLLVGLDTHFYKGTRFGWYRIECQSR